MKKLTYEVRFVTPAFLGYAEQKGQWRTPPFKALLREWWRVVKAKDVGYDHDELDELLKAENELFGVAHDDGNGGSHKSRVLIRLGEWKGGTLKSWPNDPRVKHKEVDMGGGNIGAHLYLGYGPLSYAKGVGTSLKDAHPAVDANESATLSIYPESVAQGMETPIKLINWFGTIGGRSRNGWGSLMLSGNGIASEIDRALVASYSRPLAECLRLDWPHAFGRDEKGLLIWKTKKTDFSSWSEVMKAMAEIKIAFRTSVSINKNKDIADPKLDCRHILAYPITNHGLGEWCETERNGKFKTDKRGKLIQGDRLANQLRFKVFKSNDKFYGIAYHLPCSVPRELLTKLTQAEITFIAEKQKMIWKGVHDQIDSLMMRIA